MSMNLSWLEDFLALAASGNFSRAADERHMTQPAFSRRIRALEEWLGTDLFDRSTQPATLTQAGEWFKGAAQDLLARVARVPGEARAVAEQHSTTLRFAATHALSFTFLPVWLRSMEARTAVGPLRVVSDVAQRCEALLMQGEVQFVLSHAHPKALGQLQQQGFASVKVGEDLLVPVSVPIVKGKDKGKPQFSIKGASKAAPLPLLSYSPESALGRILAGVQGKALEKVPGRTVFTAHLASVLRTMALDGRGMAWLPQTVVADDVERGRLVEAAPDRIDLEVRLYRDKTALGKAGEAFWDAVTMSNT